VERHRFLEYSQCHKRSTPPFKAQTVYPACGGNVKHPKFRSPAILLIETELEILLLQHIQTLFTLTTTNELTGRLNEKSMALTVSPPSRHAYVAVFDRLGCCTQKTALQPCLANRFVLLLLSGSKLHLGIAI
jgi:hypothetical protein